MATVAVLALPATSAATATASGRCSKAEATAVVKRLGLGEAAFIPNPVYAVICGSFMGPGSETMVVSLASGGTSVPFEGWAVFRFAGGAWQLVMQQNAGGQISAAGGGIRETVNVSRPGDPRCCPSGGSKARIWRWNGTRFAVGPWKGATPPAPSAPSSGEPTGYFKTPSGNIVCIHWAGTPVSLVCRIESGLRSPPTSRRAGCSPAWDISLEATGRARTGRSVCPGEDEGDAGPFVYRDVARILAYGKSWSGGGLRCASAETGLTCRNKSGKGFFLSRERWRAF